MLYYVGEKFDKKECRQYKTLKNALTAAAKDKVLKVWDENGMVVGGLIDNVSEGTTTVAERKRNESMTVKDGREEDKAENVPSEPENAGDAANTTSQTGEEGIGQQENEEETVGEDAETFESGGEEDKAENVPCEPENTGNEANTTSQTGEDGSGQQDGVIIPQGTIKVTVVCDGALNIRRSPAWGNDNICGRAMRGQSYYGKEIHIVDGKKLIRTIDDLYLSGQPEHTKIEQI